MKKAGSGSLPAKYSIIKISKSNSATPANITPSVLDFTAFWTNNGVFLFAQEEEEHLHFVYHASLFFFLHDLLSEAVEVLAFSPAGFVSRSIFPNNEAIEVSVSFCFLSGRAMTISPTSWPDKKMEAKVFLSLVAFVASYTLKFSCHPPRYDKSYQNTSPHTYHAIVLLLLFHLFHRAFFFGIIKSAQPQMRLRTKNAEPHLLLHKHTETNPRDANMEGAFLPEGKTHPPRNLALFDCVAGLFYHSVKRITISFFLADV